MAALNARISDAVHFVPKSSQPSYDPSEEKSDLDYMCMVSIGQRFKYIIPSFQFLSVDMRQMRIKRYTNQGQERNSDMFVRNDASLCRAYPEWLKMQQ